MKRSLWVSPLRNLTCASDPGDVPFFLSTDEHPCGAPVTARVHGCVPEILPPEHAAACPLTVPERACRFVVDEEDRFFVYLGLPPAITRAGLHALFYEPPCSDALSRLAALGSDLAEEEGVRNISGELRIGREILERELAGFLPDTGLCLPVLSLEAAASDDDIREAAARKGPEGAAGRIRRMWEFEGFICGFSQAALERRVARALERNSAPASDLPDPSGEDPEECSGS